MGAEVDRDLTRGHVRDRGGHVERAHGPVALLHQRLDVGLRLGNAGDRRVDHDADPIGARGDVQARIGHGLARGRDGELRDARRAAGPLDPEEGLGVEALDLPGDTNRKRRGVERFDRRDSRSALDEQPPGLRGVERERSQRADPRNHRARRRGPRGTLTSAARRYKLRVIFDLLAGNTVLAMEAATPEQGIPAGEDASDAPPFSLELNQDQKDIRDWVHGFAEQTVRPAAAEWDEREETPWPVIQEAAKIGLYSLEGIAQFWYDASGIMFPIVNEELFWGDAGIGMSIMGTTLAVAAIRANGTPEQWGEWMPQCFGSESEPQVGAFCVSEPDAGSDVSSLRTRARYDEATDEWVLNGQKAWATNGGIANVHVIVATVDPELGVSRPRVVRDPAGDKGPRDGH